MAGNLKKIGYKRLNINIILLFADNLATIKFANNLDNYPQVKHIDIQYHKKYKQISDVILKHDYIKTSKMVVDGLTKLLTFIKY